MSRGMFDSYEEFFITILFSLIYTLSGLYGSIWLFKYLDKKYDWLKDIWKRLIIGIVVVELWSLLIYVIVTPVLLLYLRNASITEITPMLKDNMIYPLIMGIPGMLIISVVEFFNNWKISYLKQEKLKAEMMDYKYQALNNQLNPHFLFNSFNVLSSLVFESPALAVKFIDQLSDLYQRVLNSKDKGLIPLSEELEFIRSYSFLLKTRFEDKLEINVDVHVEDDEWIAPMVLQLLIENAVKHNSISKSEPLVIHIQKKGNMIEARNKVRLKKAVPYSNGTGLHNIQQRYSFFTNQAVEVTEIDNEFLVRIPVLKRNLK